MAKKKRAAAKAEAEDDWVAAAEEAAAAAAAAAVEEAAADSEAEAPEESLEEEVEVAEAESEADDEAEGEDEGEDEGAPSAPVDAYDNGKTKKVEPRFGLLFLVGLVVSGLRALLALVLDPFGRSARGKAAARSKRITAVGAARSGPMKKSERVEYGAKKSKKSESYRKQGEYGAKKFIKP